MWPPLDHLQQVHVFPVLRAPELDAGLQVDKYLMGEGAKGVEPSFSQWWDKTEQAQNEAQKIPFKYKKDLFYCKGTQTLTWVAE